MAASLQPFAQEQAGKLLPGQQRYHVNVPGTSSAQFLSVVSFEATEQLGEPYRITIALTHVQALNRSDYLGKPASFHITPPSSDWRTPTQPTAEPRIFSGCITRFNQVSRSADVHQYEIVIEPRVARLKLATASRIYQNQTAPQIIEAILRRHGFDGSQFQFKTRRNYPVHAFRMQYGLSDWSYIHLLMRQAGMYCYFAAGQHGDVFGDVIIFGDDIDHYIYEPGLIAPYRETAGLEANTEAVFSLQTHTQTVAQSVRVADYNPAQAWDRFRSDANIARTDTTTYGQPYVYGTHHLDQEEAQWEAQLRHEAAIAQQIVYHGSSNVLALRPARILRMDQPLPDAPNGQVIVSVTHRGARDTAYSNSYTAIPGDRRYRLPLDEANWPTIPGTLSARVTSPDKYEYAYIDQRGEYIVRFDFDFDDWRAGGESVRLRLAKPFAGGGQTGFHFPVLAGTEAAIAFTDGNPNKPYIAYLHHNSRQSDLIVSDDRWLSRNVIRTQSDNKLQMEDWAGEEHVKLSTEHSGKSQLTLGHLPTGQKVDGRRQKRGEGFELKTSGQGAMRAKGILITAEDQPGSQHEQLDVTGAQGLLEQALQLTQSLAEAARTAQAVAADYERQKQLLDTLVKQLNKAGILVSAPAGMGLASGADMQLTAHGNIMATAGKHAEFSVLKRFTVAAGELVSVFAQKMGIKLFAASGKVEIQAQSDELLASALKDVRITSTDGKLILTAAKEVWIGAGGSYIRINGERIENGTPGDILEKCAWWGKQDPQFQSLAANSAAQTAFDERLQATLPNGEIARNREFILTRADGGEIRGKTDANGRIPLQNTLNVEGLSISFPN